VIADITCWAAGFSHPATRALVMLRACAQLFERGDERADQGVRRAGIIRRCRWQVPTRRLGVGGSGRFKEAPRGDPVKASPGAENSRIGDDPMTHKFHVGETVTIRPAISRNVPVGIYVVTKRLPDNSGEHKYRIKSADEPYERVTLESELSKA
jgi:hypothetical protein